MELNLAKESGQWHELGVDLSVYLWKVRLATKVRVENRSYKFESKK